MTTESLPLLSCKLAAALRCPKCQAEITRIEASGEVWSDGWESRTDVKLQCPKCSQDIASLEFEGPTIDGDDDGDE